MFNIIPILIILLALTGIIIVVIRKFPQLSTINVNTIRQEKEQRVKKNILNERLKRRTENLTKSLGAWTTSVTGKFSTAMKQAQEKLRSIEADLKKPEIPQVLVTKEDYEKKEEVIELHLEEAEKLSDEDEFELAEKKYIDIIAADPHNVEAFEGLGDLYYEQGMLTEAKETFKHVLKLDPSSAMSLYDLAWITKRENDLESSREYIRKALEKEPKNVKFLDLDITLAIAQKDKPGALDSIALVREINPENQKLEEWDRQLLAI